MSRKLLFLLVLCAIAAVIAYRAAGWNFDWSLFAKSLYGLQWDWLAASIAVTLGTYLLRAFRWQILLAPLKSVRILPLFAITLVGFAAIFGLGRAGELARPIWLTRREGVPLSGSFATIVVERCLDALFMISLFVVALAVVDVPTGSTKALEVLKKGVWIAAALPIVATIMLFLVRANSARISRWIPFRRIASMVESFAQGLSFLQDGKSLGLVLLHSLVLWIAIPLQFWMMMRGMNFTLSPGACTIVMVGSAIGSVAQLPGGVGGGLQAAYIVCLTVLFQIPAPQAAATALIMTAISYGPTIAIGGVYMLSQGMSLRELRTAMPAPESKAS